MITTFLKVNQLFTSVLLIFIGFAGLILINYHDILSINSYIALGILCTQLIFMSVYNQNTTFLSQSNFALFFFILFSVFFSVNLNDISFYGGYFLLSLILFQILECKDYSFSLLNPFDLSFLGALMVVIHPPFTPFLIALVLHFIIMGKTQIRSLILSILGILASSVLMLELIFIADKQNTFLALWEKIHFIGFEWNNNYFFLIPIFIIAFISVIDYFQHINQQKTSKKILFINLFLILAAGFIYITLYGNDRINFLVFCLPLSILLSHYSLYGSNFKKEIGIWVVVLSLILFRFSDKIQLPDSLNMITF